MNDKDFEKIEQLLQTTEFQELTPAEKELVLAQISETDYLAMRELYMHAKGTHPKEILPSPYLKSKLDKALAVRKTRPAIVNLQLPLYQVAAVAMLCFIIGLAIPTTHETPAKIVTNTVREVKYINRPIEKVRYVVIPAKYTQKLHPTQQPEPEASAIENIVPVQEITIETNPETLRQHEIAMTNIQHALNEKSGVSMGGDTVLQKMMVTVY
jgi:hypothetical protein